MVSFMQQGPGSVYILRMGSLGKWEICVVLQQQQQNKFKKVFACQVFTGMYEKEDQGPVA